MAGLDPTNGLTILKYNEILDDLNKTTIEYFGYTIDTSADSVVGMYNAINSYQFANLWELAQGIYDSQSILASQGEALENNALLTGAVRKQPTQSYGTNWYIGDSGTTVPLGSLMESVSGAQFEAPYDIIIQESLCVQADYKVAVLLEDTPYRITVDDNLYYYNTGATVTDTDVLNILDSLASQISNDNIATAVVTIDEDDVYDSFLTVAKIESSSSFSLNSTTYLVPNNIYTPELIVAVDSGAVIGDKNSINKILTPITGWVATLNPVDLNLGQDQETDDEFRTRVLESYSASGSGTPDTIANRVEGVNGVVAAIVRENTTFVTDSNGVPPKSYEVVVEGGTESAIAQVIWDNKVATVPTYGQVAVTVPDSRQQDQIVYLTRPTNEFGYINISYTLYDEESFPSDGEEKMKEACVVYGDTLGIGEDIIPKRFASAIYDNVSGLDDVTVTIAIQTDTNTDPDQSAYSPNRIPISNIETTSFAVGRSYII